MPGYGIPAAIADWAHPAGPGGARYEAAAAVLTTGGANPLLPHLERDLASASAINIAVAFVLPSGVERTIAFCVSQRHADFMRQWFRHHEVPCAAVHAGATSDQRSLSLEQLAAVHLFVRSAKRRGANSAPFVYCGPVSFVDWQGDAPITVRWKLESALPERLVRELPSPGFA